MAQIVYRKIGTLNISDQAMAAKEILKWNYIDTISGGCVGMEWWWFCYAKPDVSVSRHIQNRYCRSCSWKPAYL